MRTAVLPILVITELPSHVVVRLQPHAGDEDYLGFREPSLEWMYQDVAARIRRVFSLWAKSRRWVRLTGVGQLPRGATSNAWWLHPLG